MLRSMLSKRKRHTEDDEMVFNVDECVRALQTAVAEMERPLEVYIGILRLIAQLVPYLGTCEADAWESVLWPNKRSFLWNNTLGKKSRFDILRN